MPDITHILSLARDCSFLLVILIGLGGLSIWAFTLLDRIVTGFAKWVGLWPFLKDAIWAYARSRSEKEEGRNA